MFGGLRKLGNLASGALKTVGSIGSAVAKPLGALSSAVRPIASAIPGVGGFVGKALSYVNEDNINKLASGANSLGNKINDLSNSLG